MCAVLRASFLQGEVFMQTNLMQAEKRIVALKVIIVLSVLRQEVVDRHLFTF